MPAVILLCSTGKGLDPSSVDLIWSHRNVVAR